MENVIGKFKKENNEKKVRLYSTPKKGILTVIAGVLFILAAVLTMIQVMSYPDHYLTGFGVIVPAAIGIFLLLSPKHKGLYFVAILAMIADAVILYNAPITIVLFMLLALIGFSFNFNIAGKFPLLNLIAAVFALFALFGAFGNFVKSSDVFVVINFAALFKAVAYILINLSMETYPDDRPIWGKLKNFFGLFAGRIDAIDNDGARVGSKIIRFAHILKTIIKVCIAITLIAAAIAILIGIIFMIDEFGFGLLIIGIAIGGALVLVLNCFLWIVFTWLVEGYGQMINDTEDIKLNTQGGAISGGAVESNPDELPEL